MVRKTIIALMALAAVGFATPTGGVFARGGGGGGHGGGGGGFHGGGGGFGGMHTGGVGGMRFSGAPAGGMRFAGVPGGGMSAGRSVFAPGGNRFVGAPFVGRQAFTHHFRHSFAFRRHHHFHRFAFIGAPFAYAAYNGCWRKVWTAYGWRWADTCNDYGY